MKTAIRLSGITTIPITSEGYLAGNPSMGVQKKAKQLTKTKAKAPRLASPKPTTPAEPVPKPRSGRKPKEKIEAAQALRTTLFIPENQLDQALPYYEPGQPQLLTHRVMKELLERDRKRAVVLLLLKEKMEHQTTIYEVDLADLIVKKAIRQLALTRTNEGWIVQVLPLWKQEFLTLVSLKKEKRHYNDIDRLISNISKLGPLPPTILIGNPSNE